jgi:tetratricopeptide (TPR) repeat protein
MNRIFIGRKTEQEAFTKTIEGLGPLGEHEKGLRMSRRAYRAAPDVIEKEFKALAYRPEAALKTIRQSFSEQIALGLGPEIGKTLAGLPPVELARLYFQLMRYELEVDESGNLNPEILISALAELISHKPESAALRIETANLYERLGKRERSIAILEEIVDKILSSTQNDIRRRLVGLYSAGGDWKSTLRHLREIEEPLTAEEYVLLAELLVQEGQFNKALVAYENSLALADDQDTERLDRFGLYNLGVDNFQRAEELFRKKIALRQDDAMGFSNLSEALYGQKKYEEAKDDAERALALAPDLPLPAARLFRICTKMGLLDEAERYRQKAVQNLSQADSYDQACILAILGDEEEALEQLERVIKATPEYRAWAQFDPDLRELRGNAVFQRLVSSAEPPTE